MKNSSFKGIIPFFSKINLSLYSLFEGFPIYIGKIFVGSMYGIICAIIINFWGKQFFSVVFFGLTVLWILNILNCISIKWKEIQTILGVDVSSWTTPMVHEFFSIYTIEITSSIIIFVMTYAMLRKYK